MSSMNRLVSRLFPFCLAALGAAGCAVDGAGGQEPEPATDTASSALIRGTSAPRMGYACSGLKCTCTGDVDCNDMFSDGVCGDIASCDDTDPYLPVCSCMTVRVKGPTVGVVAPGGSGVLAAP